MQVEPADGQEAPVPAQLISAPELAEEMLGERPPVVLDVRWSLAGSDRNAYREAHLPGAVFVDLDAQLAAPVGDGTQGRHPLPDPDQLQQTWRDAGINDTDSVVVYDARDASAAARAWWLLRWSGLREVRVLSGGIEAWQRAGLRTVRGDGTPLRPGAVAVRPGSMPVVHADQVARLATAGLVIDARAAARYRGEVEPVDPKAGHIPGAVNLPFTTLIDADGTFVSDAELRAAFQTVRLRPGVAAAASCGSGVTACHLILGAAQVGIRMALYPGSWSQWCAEDRPVETGPGRGRAGSAR